MTTDRVTVVLAEDHSLVRAGLRRMIETFDDIAVVGEAENGREAVELAERLSPAVVVMDVRMPRLNGVEATRRILQRRSEVAIVGLTSHDNEETLHDMLRAGARGFLSKRCDPAQLRAAILNVAGGGFSVSGDTSTRVVDAFLRAREGEESALDLLTSREREILQNLAEGSTNREVADALGLSVKTVETHRTNLMRKLGLHNTADLVRIAVRTGLTMEHDDPTG